jgi:hypothetical protein
MVYQERRCLNPACKYLWDCANMPGHERCPECGGASRHNCAHHCGIVVGKHESKKSNVDQRIWKDEPE